MDMYKIPAICLPRLQSEIDELNKRSKRLKLNSLMLHVGEPIVEKHQGRLGSIYEVVYHMCHIVGPEPRINGWKLVGVVEPQESGENIVKMVPNHQCPMQFRTVTMLCEHCNTSRRRNFVCLLQDEEGSYKQVGRNCLKDFLGHASPESLLKAAELNWDSGGLLSGALSDEEWGFGGGHPRSIDIHPFLIYVSVVMRKLGWLPRSKAGETEATADIAWRIMTSHGLSTESFIKDHKLHPAEKDVELAQKTISWAKTLDPKTESDYIYNLGVVARSGIVNEKNCGIIASAISAYQREIDKQTQFAGLSHVGTPDKREVFKGITLQSMRTFESMYGAKFLCKFTDQSGNVLVWWTSTDPDWLKVNETFDIKATVKEHSVYQGCPQTELSRVAKV